MTPGFPALASPRKSSAPAFARSIRSPRTPALPPAPGKAESDFAACDPYFPILRGTPSKTLQDARAHPSGAAFLLFVRGLLDPCPIDANAFHSSKSSVAFSRFVAGVACPASRPCFLEPIPGIVHLSPLTDASFVFQGCRRLSMDALPHRARISLCLLKARPKKSPLQLQVSRPNRCSLAPSSAPSSTASASSAITCSASLPTGLMPSSALSVTKADLPRYIGAFFCPLDPAVTLFSSLCLFPNRHSLAVTLPPRPA